MTITRITDRLNGEQVVELSPQDANAAATTWRRRPNLFPGRALTAPTLEGRSRWAAGHLVMRGQAFTPGIVTGLEVGFQVAAAGDSESRPQVTLHIAGGRGLAASGEDFWIPRAIEVDWYGLPVVAPPALFETGAAPIDYLGTLLPRAIGPSLGELLASNPGAVPPAGILVMQPAAVDVAAIDANDPCDRCGCAEDNVNYEDWRLADAVRLLWYAWPADLLLTPPSGPRFRNGLAYAVFDQERGLAVDAVMPWEEFGVPIALIGLDAAHVPTFSDRAAVARVGGQPRESRLQLGVQSGGELLLAPRPRLAPLWQAQIEQLAGQVADLGDPPPAPATLAQAFGRLPPVGLLPTNVLDLNNFGTGFFPPAFDLDAVPVPVEQLDVAVREAAPLAPLDLSLGERVRVLVPVSQASWEPRLLMTETIDPLFQQTLDEYLLARGRALAARQSLRLTAATIRQAMDATPPAVPDIAADPGALEPESYAPWGPPTAGDGGHVAPIAAGLHQHFFDSATATVTPAAGESLYAWIYLDPDHPPQTLMLQWRTGTSWEQRAYWGANLIGWGTDGTVSRRPMGELPALGQWLRLAVPAAALGLEGKAVNGMAFTLYDGRAAFGQSGRLTGANAAETAWFGGKVPAGAVLFADAENGWSFLTPNQLWAPFEPAFGLTQAADPVAHPTGESTLIDGLLAGSALATLSAHERNQLPVRGLKGFIDYLSSRTNRADDIIDYGFVKVQTDIYRVRQLILNTTNATRLATSPTLAGIAQAETAVASQERISTFFDELKGVQTASTDGLPPVSTPVSNAAGNIGLNAATPRAFSMAAAMPAATNVSLGATAGAAKTTAGSAGTIAEIGSIGAIGTVAGIGEVATVKSANLALATEITPVFATTFTPVDIANANPLVGAVAIRNLSIAERLAQPKALEARDYSSSSRQDAVSRLLVLADTLRQEDSETANQPGPTSGLFGDLTMYAAKNEPFLENDETYLSERRRPFADFIDATKRPTLMPLLLMPPKHFNTAGNVVEPDESGHFSDATDVADTTVALLRQVEGRVRLFRDAIAACQQALASLQADYAAALADAGAWDAKLAEARHDVAVTRALIVEEQARLDAINARRKAVLAAEVRFLAYLRPRDADTLMSPPVHAVDPAVVEAAVPTCLRQHPDVPDELVAMLAVVRDAPAAWFGQGLSWFDGLSRVDLLVKTVQTAQLRTQLAAAATVPTAAATGLAGAIAQITAKHSQVVSLARAASLQIDTAKLAGLTWQGAFQQAVHVVSLGDLISGEHGRGFVATRAATFYDQFSEVCACLHAGFSGVLPAIRLGWATQLSEFDTAPNLRNLASLPRWNEIAYLERKRMQAFADWLFSQASTSEARAQALVNDVVRMCLLLASHAPVDRIIAGRLPRPVTVRPGIRMPLVPLDGNRLRVGMQAVIYKADRIVARALVEDVGASEASARVLQTADDSVDLDETAKVHFADAASIGFMTLPVRAAV